MEPLVNTLKEVQTQDGRDMWRILAAKRFMAAQFTLLQMCHHRRQPHDIQITDISETTGTEGIYAMN
jgi:hypothetical protein